MNFLRLLLRRDQYDFGARTTPAIIIFLPIYLAGLIAFWLYLSDVILINAIGFLVTLASIPYLEQTLRLRGQNIQKVLFEKWGGAPSVTMLRLRDSRIDEISKKRYHKFLSIHVEQMKEITWEYEEKFPEEADKVYFSANEFLKSKTRDGTKFNLLLKENISYGFWRNLYGSKIIPLILDVFIIAICTLPYLLRLDKVEFGDLFNLAVLTLIITLVHFAWFLFFSFENKVKRQAETYASRLLETCDILDS